MFGYRSGSSSSDDLSPNRTPQNSPPSHRRGFNEMAGDEGSGPKPEEKGSASSTSTSNSINNLEIAGSVKIQIVLPEFWPANIKIWFAQVEAQFALNSITSDKTKFNLLVSQLKSNVLQQVASIVDNPPANDKYPALKEQIIHVFGESEQKHLKKLLAGVELGDRKPSQLLNEQRRIGGALIGEQMLRSLWLDRLPPHIQTVVASLKSQPLAEQAETADLIWAWNPDNAAAAGIASIRSLASTAAAHAPTQPNAPFDDTSLHAQIASLTAAINALKYQRSRHRSPSQHHRRRRSKSNTHQHSSVCWYHAEYGQRAMKCTPPCKFGNRSATKKAHTESDSEN